ncbi:unnamed protein product [marine sediment metagenome]|uniref:Uncharacterized protein n=1 Tax=marine sediment metagenome TaxID=412755 RepID=X1BQH6_9ZZZZ
MLSEEQISSELTGAKGAGTIKDVKKMARLIIELVILRNV